MASTLWKRLYGPVVAIDTSSHVLLTAAANTADVITKFTVSNVTGTAALATITITPSGGAGFQVIQKVIPGFPTMGGVVEIVELEGHILNAGDALTFTAGTANALAPMISGVAYTA